MLTFLVDQQDYSCHEMNTIISNGEKMLVLSEDKDILQPGGEKFNQGIKNH
jgi:hypothetical protein